MWLRRAVSTAYYALYHHIAQAAAQYLVPSGSEVTQLQASRSFNHAAMKEACEWISGRRGRVPEDIKPLVDLLRPTAMTDAAAAFCDLQEARHKADYDNLAPFSKATALASVQDAETAMTKIDAADAEHREAFFAVMALRTAIRKA
jgi:hypothetical protein